MSERGIRYYMGRHKIQVLLKGKSKQLIKHLESGFTGNKTCGYKNIKPGDKDIVPVRLCWRHRKEGHQHPDNRKITDFI